MTIINESKKIAKRHGYWNAENNIYKVLEEVDAYISQHYMLKHDFEENKKVRARLEKENLAMKKELKDLRATMRILKISTDRLYCKYTNDEIRMRATNG